MLLFLFRIPECLFKPGTFDIIVKKKIIINICFENA